MIFSKTCRHCAKSFTSSAKKDTRCSIKCIILSSYVAKNGCWEWNRARNKDGYGLVRRAGCTPYAHRASYEELVGPIPKGLFVLHKCDNPPCINPDHLYCGTLQDNNRDMDERGRRFIMPKSIGEKHHAAKFRRSDVKKVRARWASGESMRSIAIAYNVVPESVRKIIRGETWAWLK